ncbi:13401_t:CDS:2 [Ambispora gerdemannii]|uniref:13401_t:CDS:1 n=1 Tax=Ambispora gerdemannii TaxID=144530 RepID=A0A9N9EIJ5_9GLOM|nr:13401_t:CDS:2 [Ambispora gerdemannii]
MPTMIITGSLKIMKTAIIAVFKFEPVRTEMGLRKNLSENTPFYGEMKEKAKSARKITKETGSVGNLLGYSPEKHCCNCHRSIDERSGYFHCKNCNVDFCSSECKERQESRKCKNTIEYIPSNLVKNNNLSPDLAQENHELKQQLAEVQKQLAQVLEELKKFKSNSSGKDNKKLDQQIAQNQKLIENGEKVSQAEVKEQVQKSQALLKEASVGVVSTKDNSSGSLLYVIGGSVVVIGLLAS